MEADAVNKLRDRAAQPLHHPFSFQFMNQEQQPQPLDASGKNIVSKRIGLDQEPDGAKRRGLR
jgi:hypothetical protein